MPTISLQTLKITVAQPMEKAESLPFSAYRDQQVYDAEKTNIFLNDWIFICTEQEIPKKGDYLALFLADEPVLIIRGQDGKIRAMSNVCRHRGTLLNLVGKSNSKRMVCPYHAWTYDDKGTLLGVPFAEKGEVKLDEHCLPLFQLEIWHGLIFINLSAQAEPFNEKVSNIDKYLKLFHATRFKKTYTSPSETWQANWKLALENAMESYHLFKVHPQTLETVTPTKQSFYLEGSRNCTITAGKMKGSSPKLLKWLTGESAKIYDHYILISLPPSFVGILTYESFDWIRVLPESLDSCSIQSGGMSTATPDKHSEEQQFVETFFAEDKAICERIQLGMLAEKSSGGKLIHMERVLVDFHHYLAYKLFDETTPEHYRSAEFKHFFSK